MAIWTVHIDKLRHEAELIKKVEGKEEDGEMIGKIGIGWPRIDNLHDFKTREDFKEKLRDLYDDASPQRIGVHAGVLYRYTHMIQEGDKVLLPMKTSDVIKYGEFINHSTEISPFRDEEFHEEYVHCREVKWLKDIKRDELTQEALYSIGSAMTLSQPSEVVEEQVESLYKGEKVKTRDEQEVEPDEVKEILLEDQVEEQLDEFITTKLKERKGYKYQKAISGLLEGMGYNVELGPKGADDKKDIIAYTDELGVKDPTIRVEVKSGSSTSGVEDIRALAGVLEGNVKGLFVSRMGFTSAAKTFAKNKSEISLLTGEEVVELILKHYNKLPPFLKEWIPLKQVWIPDVK